MIYADWQQRVLEELTQLRDRADKLEKFITSSNIETIERSESALLFAQFYAMRAYQAILTNRVELWKEAST